MAHGQPPYQVPFRSIQLVPAPPPWFGGGSDVFLERVRQRARETETLPILDLTTQRIKLAFIQSPWVESVVQVSYPPHGLRVKLQYREPVAKVRVPKDKEYLLDESGRILPEDEVDRDRLEQTLPLIVIHGDGMTGPLEPQPGGTWKSRPGANDINEGNTRIPEAAKLAAFLTRKMHLMGASLAAALEIVEINPIHKSGRRFVFNREGSCFMWLGLPGEEGEASLTDEDKWELLYDWSQHTTDRCRTPHHCYEFTKKGLVHKTWGAACSFTPLPIGQQP